MKNDTSIENIIIAEPDVKPNTCNDIVIADIDAWHYGAPF
jgi:hypothetical protein